MRWNTKQHPFRVLDLVMTGKLLARRKVDRPQHLDTVDETELGEELRERVGRPVDREHVHRRREPNLRAVGQLAFGPGLRRPSHESLGDRRFRICGQEDAPALLSGPDQTRSADPQAQRVLYRTEIRPAEQRLGVKEQRSPVPPVSHRFCSRRRHDYRRRRRNHIQDLDSSAGAHTDTREHPAEFLGSASGAHDARAQGP